MQWVVALSIGGYTLLFALFNLPPSRAYLADVASDILASRLGTEVRIADIEVGLFNRVTLRDVEIKDTAGHSLLSGKLLSAKLDLTDLLVERRVSLHTISLLDLDVSLYQQAAGEPANFQFLIDAFKKEEPSGPSRIDLKINSLVVRRTRVSWDRYHIPRKDSIIDPNHLAIDDLDASISLKTLTPDSLNLRIRQLSLGERSGFRIDRLALRLAANREKCRIEGLTLDLPHSHVRQDSLSMSYDIRNFFPSLRVKGTLHDSYLSLSDMRFLLPLNSTGGDLAFLISSSFELQPAKWDFSGIHIHNLPARDIPSGAFQMEGRLLLDRRRQNAIAATLHSLSVRPDFAQRLAEIFIPDTLPEWVGRLGVLHARGHVYHGSGKTDFDGDIGTDAGNISFDGSRQGDDYTATVRSHDLDIGRVLADTTHIGTADFEATATGSGKKLSAHGEIHRFSWQGYDYRDIAVEGKWDGKRLRASVTASDPNLSLIASGDFAPAHPFDDLQVSASVDAIRPSAVGWTERYADATFSGKLEANLSGRSWKDLSGHIALHDFHMATADSIYSLDTLEIKAGEADGRYYFQLHSDFAQADYLGTRPVQESTRFLDTYLHPYLPGLLSERKAGQSHSSGRFNLTLGDTRIIEAVGGLPLRLDSALTAQGYWTDGTTFSLSLETKGAVDYDGIRFGDIKIFGRGDGKEAHAVVQATKPMKETDLRMSVELNACQDSLAADLMWTDDKEGKYRGDLHLVSIFDLFTQRHLDVNLLPGRVFINDTLWNVGRGHLAWTDEMLLIDNFNISHNAQSLSLQGQLRHGTSDSISVTLKDIDIAYIMDLVDFHAVDFAGLATGTAVLSNSLDAPRVSAKLDIANFLFNNTPMGYLSVDGGWDNEEKSIVLSGIISERELSQTYINGYISPGQKGLDLKFQTQNTNIAFISRYVTGIFSDLSGRASGYLRLFGPFKELDFEGRQSVHMKCNVVPTNVGYTVESDSVIFRPGQFEIRNIRLTDTYGGSGTGQGILRHDHLHDLSYDFDFKASNLLAYDRPKELDMPFFATARVSGSMHMEGKPGIFRADMDIRPEREFSLTYILDRPETTNSSQLITFRDRSLLSMPSFSTAAPAQKAVAEPTTDIYLNFLVDMNPEATMRVLMDESTGDIIEVRGDGPIRAAYHNKGDLQLFGTYNITQGTYKLSLQDIIRKEFTIQPGSSITFIGDPGNSNLDLQAVYVVNSASLADLNIGSNFSGSTVRVNCLLNIQGSVNAPQLTFDLDLPTVNEDEKQMVRRIISTEEDMNMQIIYLLGVGRFYTYDYGSTASTQSQSSVAMKSFLSNTLTGQLNNIISNAIGSSNWSFGTNLSTGEVGWSDMEVEGLLSGRLLNNRLLVNGNFGYRDRSTYSTGFVGDFDIQWLLTPKGNISLKAYSEANDRYFTRSSLTTQGIGIMLKHDFVRFGDLFRWRRKSSQDAQNGDQ